jgi:hypothetical protein
MKRRGFFAAIAALLAAPIIARTLKAAPVVTPLEPTGLTVEKIRECAALLRAQHVPAEYYCVVHPNEYARFIAEHGTDYFEGSRVVPAILPAFHPQKSAWQGLRRSRW